MDDGRRRWWLLGAMGAILGVVLLDETVVGVALPSIQSELSISANTAHWAVNIYVLTFAALAAAAGRLGDILGHGMLMRAGLAIFGLASLACGFAESGAWLIAARAAQGVGAAIMFPISLAMVTMTFPEKERGLALGIYGAIGTTFLALGPMTGGLITEYLSWRWIFFINPPIAVAIILIVRATWREPPKQDAGRGQLDLRGLVLLVAGLTLAVSSVMEAPELGWTSPLVLAGLLLGVVLLVVFVRMEAWAPDPLIEVGLFRSPTFSGCNLAIFTAQFGKMALFVFGAMFLQEAMGFTPLQTGLALLPAVAPQIAIGPIAGRAADRFGARVPTILALLGTGAGFAVCALAASAESYVTMAVGLLFLGLVTPFLFVPPQRAIMAAVPMGQQGQAGGISMSAQLLGATVGMTFCSTLYQSTGSYLAIFASTAALALIVGAVAFLTIERAAPSGAVQ